MTRPNQPVRKPEKRQLARGPARQIRIKTGYAAHAEGPALIPKRKAVGDSWNL